MEKKNKLKDAVVSSNEEVLIQDQSPKIGSTPNYGFNTFDPITDGQTKFKEFITKDSKENWVKADTKLKEINDKTDNKVTLDKVAQTNFDFIKGKVVQDGLIELREETYSVPTRLGMKLSDDMNNFFLQFSFTPIKQGQVVSDNKGRFRCAFTDNGYFILDIDYVNTWITLASIKINKFTIGKTIDTSISCFNGKLTVMLNSQIISKSVNVVETEEKFGTLNVLGNYNIQSIAEGVVSGICTYNIPLTPQEIKYNFSILNNSPSINQLKTTDSTGKTSILKALKGTQNWVEIDTSEVRDTTTYDYKLDSINGNLGSVLSVSDYIDRARKVKVVNTKEVVLNGSESWSLYGSSSNVQYFVIAKPTGSKATTIVLCNNVQSELSAVDKENSYIGGSNLNYAISKTKASTAEQFKAYLAQQKTNGTPITVRYQLATPQEIQLTDEQFKTYDAYKKLISLGGVGDMYDVLEIKEDGSGVWTQNTKSYKFADIFPNKTSFTSYWKCEPDGVTQCYIYHNGSNNSTDMNIASGKLICDKLNYVEGLYGTNNTGIYNINGYISVGIKTSEIEGMNSTNCKNLFFDYVRDYLVVVPLKTPTTTHIPKELVPTIQTVDKINILSVDSAVKPSSFKATVPVDRVGEMQTQLNNINTLVTQLKLDK